jgi:hypothetical protein
MMSGRQDMNQYSHFAVEEADLIRKETKADPANWR